MLVPQEGILWCSHRWATSKAALDAQRERTRWGGGTNVFVLGLGRSRQNLKCVQPKTWYFWEKVLFNLAHLRDLPYSRRAPLSWSWDFTGTPTKSWKLLASRGPSRVAMLISNWVVLQLIGDSRSSFMGGSKGFTLGTPVYKRLTFLSGLCGCISWWASEQPGWAFYLLNDQQMSNKVRVVRTNQLTCRSIGFFLSIFGDDGNPY